MAFYQDKVEYEDILGLCDEGFFPNHGFQVCVAELHDNCKCLRCKPRVRKHWRISFCKNGFAPVLWEEEPRGCTFLDTSYDEKHCAKYCLKYDPEIKEQARQEVFGDGKTT
jgi:hypothetical protein